MATIRGTAMGREGSLPGVLVAIKNERFETLYEAACDEAGRFSLSVPDGTYPFLTAVREYGSRYLEYWAQNVPAQGDLTLDVYIDTLEVYGLHAFHVKGAANALTVYFRPMSLEKFQSGAQDIAPELDKRDITVLVDGQQSEVYSLNRVQEYIGEEAGLLTAYLLQTSVPGSADEWKRVDVTVRDSDGRFGCAALFQCADGPSWFCMRHEGRWRPRKAQRCRNLHLRILANRARILSRIRDLFLREGRPP